MVLTMARPTRRKRTQMLQFRQRIPEDVRDKAAGTTITVPVGGDFATVRISSRTREVQFSLHTQDAAEAKSRQAEALVHVNAHWDLLRGGGAARLTHKQTLALAGILYREMVARYEDDPGPPEAWEAAERLLTMPIGVPGSGLQIPTADAPQPSAALPKGPTRVDKLLAVHGLVVDEVSRRAVLEQVRLAWVDGARRLKANAEGDYGTDVTAQRFPTAEAVRPATKQQKVSLSGLVDDWWQEARAGGMKPATYTNYRGAFRQLILFLKHDDATKLSPGDVVAFKNHRLTTPDPKRGVPVSPRTVKDNDLAALKSVLGWAVSNHKLPTNAAQGITVTGRAKTKSRRQKGFSAGEVDAILSAALATPRGPQQTVQSHAVKRWVPWVLAYTGARVGEILQLRKQDVQERGDHWVIVITPEAGTVKTDEEREVPLHPHLVEMGFADFAAGSASERLFISLSSKPKGRRRTAERQEGSRSPTTALSLGATPPDPEDDIAGKVKGAANHLREFIRAAVPELVAQPNHGWRHLFETRCRQVGVEDYYQRVITGHSLRDVHENYGDPAGLYREICRLPRFELNNKTGALGPMPAPQSANLGEGHLE